MPSLAGCSISTAAATHEGRGDDAPHGRPVTARPTGPWSPLPSRVAAATLKEHSANDGRSRLVPPPLPAAPVVRRGPIGFARYSLPHMHHVRSHLRTRQVQPLRAEFDALAEAACLARGMRAAMRASNNHFTVRSPTDAPPVVVGPRPGAGGTAACALQISPWRGQPAEGRAPLDERTVVFVRCSRVRLPCHTTQPQVWNQTHGLRDGDRIAVGDEATQRQRGDPWNLQAVLHAAFRSLTIDRLC